MSRSRFPFLLLVLGLLVSSAVSIHAASYQFNVSGTGDWATPGSWTGGIPSTTGTAFIDNSGTATIIGESETTNLVYIGDKTIQGLGGGLYVTGTLNLNLLGDSYGGPGTLTVTNGGLVSATNTYIGYNAADNGFATVSSGGSLSSATALYLGNSGTGTLTVNAGTVTAPIAYIGFAAAGIGSATISNGGSLSASTSLYIGDSGTGSLTINGASVSTAAAYLGSAAGSSGSASIINSGALSVGTGLFYVGSSGTGTLNIGSLSSTGTVTANVQTLIGRAAGSVGTVTVTGTGSLLSDTHSGSTVNDIFDIGDIGVGTVIVQNGAQLSASSAIVFGQGGGVGSLTVQSGGLVTAPGMTIASNASTVSGSTTDVLTVNGGAVLLTGAVYESKPVGSSSQLFVSNSGTFNTTGAFTMANSGGYAAANVNGGVLTSAGNFYVGAAPLGTSTTSLIVASGTAGSTAGYMNIGNSDNNNSASVSGTGAELLGVTDFYVGYSLGASGTLSISNGATAGIFTNAGGNQNVAIGNLAGSTGLVTVDGSNSSLVDKGLAGGVYVGSSGTGTLTVTNGASVSASNPFYVGNTAASVGTLTIAGSNSSVNELADGFYAGLSGTGTVTVQSGGALNVEAVSGTPGGGTVTLGGTVATSSAVLNIGASGSSTTSGAVLAANIIGLGNATLNFNQSDSISFSPAISGTLAVNQLGTGATILTGSNSYSGATTVSHGSIFIQGSISGSAVIVNNGGMLGGGGAISLSASSGTAFAVNSGGTLSPSNGSSSASTLSVTLSGSSAVMNLALGSKYTFNLGTTGSSDEINLIQGQLQLNGQQLADFTFNTLSGFGQGTYVLFNTTNGIMGSLGATVNGSVGGDAASLSDTGTQLILTVVPEPSSATLVGVCLLAGLFIFPGRRLARNSRRE